MLFLLFFSSECVCVPVNCLDVPFLHSCQCWNTWKSAWLRLFNLSSFLCLHLVYMLQLSGLISFYQIDRGVVVPSRGVNTICI